MWQQAHESEETDAKPGWPVLWGPEAGKRFSFNTHSGKLNAFFCEVFNNLRLKLELI
jgi:hypothetical protein